MRRKVAKNRKARSWYRLQTRLSDLGAMILQWIPSSRRGRGFLLLFYAAFLGFAFGTFYVSDCVPIPVYDTVTSTYNSDMSVKSLNRGMCHEDYDAYHDLVLAFLSRGIINPKKIYQPLFGFTCSYPNHIKSTSFKFTDIS